MSIPESKDNVEPYSLPLMEGRVVTRHGEVTTGSLPTADDITALIEQSKTEGYTAGYQEGIAQGQQEINARVETLAHIAKQLESPLDAIDDEVMQSLAVLAGVVAKYVVRTHLSTQPEEIVAVVKDAVGNLPLSNRKIAIHLHPDDLDMVEASLSTQPIAQPWTLQAEAALSRGGCIVKTDISTVDATLESRIEQITTAMKGDEFKDAE